jgi:hypothetical protein
MSAPSRFWAVVCALLVMVLSISAASPAVHTWIHDVTSGGCSPAAHDADSQPGADEHACAVTEFAQGEGGVAIAPIALPHFRLRQIATFCAADVRAILSPAFLRPHCCGPPLI